MEVAFKCFPLRPQWCLSITAGQIDFYERTSTNTDTAWDVIINLYLRNVALLRCVVQTLFANYNFYVTTYSWTKYSLFVMLGHNMNFDHKIKLYAEVPVPEN